MYISKKEANKTAKSWVDSLKDYTKKNEINWNFVGLQARETMGQIFALWKFELLNDKQWDNLFNEIWCIKRRAEDHMKRMF